MRKIIAALCLLASAFAAEAQQFPVVPDRTVIGRIGNPTFDSGSGPSQAIPFVSLFAAADLAVIGGHLVAGQFPTVPGIITGLMFANANASTLFGNPATSAGAPSFFTPGSLPIKNNPATTDLVVLADLAAGGALKQVPIAAIGTVGSVASINGLTGAILGVNTNTLSTKTLPFTITNSNTPCGTTVNVAGGPGTLTLSSVSGFNSACVIQVCNTAPNDNSHNAILLAGFPRPTLQHLWMSQCEELSIVSGAWLVTKFPGKFIPGFVMSCFVDIGGSNSNDGLVSNAAANAVQDPQQCILNWNAEIELFGSQPTIMLTNGQINPQNGGAGPLTLVGGVPKVIFVQGNGGNATLRNTGGNVVAQVQDFGGYFIFVNITLDCTSAASHPCFSLFMHQQGGADLNANVTIKGGGTTDVGIIADSVAKVNGNNLVTIAGVFANAFSFNQNSVLQISNGLTVAANTTVVNNVFLMNQGSQLLYSGPLTAGSPVSFNTLFTGRGNSNLCLAMGTVTGTFTGATQWSVLGASTISNLTSNAVPGAAGSITSAAFANGFLGAATNGGC